MMNKIKLQSEQDEIIDSPIELDMIPESDLLNYDPEKVDPAL
jgi:hypothetical protein